MLITSLCHCQVEIWFKPVPAMTSAENAEEEETPQEQQQQQQQPAGASAVLDRVACLRPVMFDVFAHHTTDPPVLDYQEMVRRRCSRLLPRIPSRSYFRPG